MLYSVSIQKTAVSPISFSCVIPLTDGDCECSLIDARLDSHDTLGPWGVLPSPGFPRAWHASHNVFQGGTSRNPAFSCRHQQQIPALSPQCQSYGSNYQLATVGDLLGHSAWTGSLGAPKNVPEGSWLSGTQNTIGLSQNFGKSIFGLSQNLIYFKINFCTWSKFVNLNCMKIHFWT